MSYTSIVDEYVHSTKQLQSLLSSRTADISITEIQWKNPAVNRQHCHSILCFIWFNVFLPIIGHSYHSHSLSLLTHFSLTLIFFSLTRSVHYKFVEQSWWFIIICSETAPYPFVHLWESCLYFAIYILHVAIPCSHVNNLSPCTYLATINRLFVSCPRPRLNSSTSSAPFLFQPGIYRTLRMRKSVKYVTRDNDQHHDVSYIVYIERSATCIIQRGVFDAIFVSNYWKNCEVLRWSSWCQMIIITVRLRVFDRDYGTGNNQSTTHGPR